MAEGATATKPAAPKTEAGEKYSTMIVGVGKTREAAHEKLLALAESLGVKVGHLVWHAVDKILANPPKPGDIAVPAAARSSVIGIGHAPGFWIIPVLGADGKATGVKVQEVAKRGDATGREFYRFSKGDDAASSKKNRDRAKAQAIRGAQADMRFLGVKGDVTVVELAAAK